MFSFFVKRTFGWLLRIVFIVNFIFGIGLLLSYASAYISPAKYTWLAFFGLAYPVFLSVNIIFLLFWFFLRSKYLFFSLLCIAAGYKFLAVYIPIKLSEKNVAFDNAHKLLSYNVRLFDLYNWTGNKHTRNKIFNFLKKEKASIICFQEFYLRKADNYFNTLDTLLQFLPNKHYAEAYTHVLNIGKQSFGLATFSVYPIINHFEIIFGQEETNNALATDIKINDDTIRVINVHLASIRFQKADYDFIGDATSASQWYNHKFSEQKIIERLNSGFIKRAEQIEILVKYINKSPYPVIVCGDFNDTPVSYCYQTISKKLTDAFVNCGSGIGKTYVGKIPLLRIDYIFHSNHIESLKFTRHPEEYSDHHPISFWFKINKGHYY
jgi:endonuclease/exonuclease/phosphatase family metal-dependent hydrolase